MTESAGSTEGSATDAPWYAGGLAFECTQCGNCCTGGPGAVWVTDDDLRAMAEVRGVSYGEILLQHTRIVNGQRSLREFANGDCTFFNPRTRRCEVYAARPAQCRTWPFWSQNLQSPADWERVQTVCPGAGVGPLVPLSLIRAQVERAGL